MTRDQKTISFIIAIVYTFIVLIGSCSHMFKQPYVDPILKMPLMNGLTNVN